MALPHPVQVNTADCAHDAMDGEVVVVNLKTGHYYSLAGPAALIWSCLAAGMAPEAIVAHVQASHTGDATFMAAEVERFLGELLKEGLLMPGAAVGPGVTPSRAGEPSPFEAPVLTKHSDMEGLLLIDPVHDVTPEGWPNVPASSTGS